MIFDFRCFERCSIQGFMLGSCPFTLVALAHRLNTDCPSDFHPRNFKQMHGAPSHDSYCSCTAPWTLPAIVPSLPCYFARKPRCILKRARVCRRDSGIIGDSRHTHALLFLRSGFLAFWFFSRPICLALCFLSRIPPFRFSISLLAH